MYIAEERAGVMAVFSVGPLIGPIIGPVIGGFLTEAKGWRWDFWIIVIVAGAISGAILLVLRESYAPVLLERKASRLRKETGNGLLRSRLATAAKSFKPKARLKLLSHAAIIFPVGFFVYGWTAEYKTHWMAPIIGLAIIGIGSDAP
ncbi:hypothetical protein Neosp_010401 [[Neocosmospora] mangrovei]